MRRDVPGLRQPAGLDALRLLVACRPERRSAQDMTDRHAMRYAVAGSPTWPSSMEELMSSIAVMSLNRVPNAR